MSYSVANINDRSAAFDANFHPADDATRARVLSLEESQMTKKAIEATMRNLDGTADPKTEKRLAQSRSIQLAHCNATHRWLLGFPPVKGWYGDPSRRFVMRYFDGSAWTDKVSTGDTTISDDGVPLQ